MSKIVVFESHVCGLTGSQCFIVVAIRPVVIPHTPHCPDKIINARRTLARDAFMSGHAHVNSLRFKRELRQFTRATLVFLATPGNEFLFGVLRVLNTTARYIAEDYRLYGNIA